mmetsp:Transcript_11067/g.14470  ORF Transcript_11067/g.14470 Transcript_11067/m.14470 type:complete len:146 (+) Transcript_11067:100-537(+)
MTYSKLCKCLKNCSWLLQNFYEKLYPLRFTGKILLFLRILSGREYNTMLKQTKTVPKQKLRFGRKSKRKTDTIHEATILNDAAKTLRTLSAYFTTTATMSPPAACMKITVQTSGVNPTIIPFAAIVAESLTYIPVRAIRTEGKPI